jgi:holo-[acyl-carrier protein] synthase
MRVGIDIFEVERIKRFISEEKLSRIFTKHELDYFKTKNWAPETVAGHYCAKEAFFKAVGTGITSISKLLEIEIKHEQRGAPLYHLSYTLINEYHLNTSILNLSISHIKTMAVAVCIILHGNNLL